MSEDPIPLAEGQIEIWLESEESLQTLLCALNRALSLKTGVHDPVVATRLEKSICRDWQARFDAALQPRGIPGLYFVPPIPPGAKMWLLEAPSVHAVYKVAMWAFVTGWLHGRDCPEPEDPANRVANTWACHPDLSDVEKVS
jgi:hypothetical protein